MRRLPALGLALTCWGASALSDAQTADPAARGLDVFVQVPDRAAPGTTVPVQVQAYGFPTAGTLVPLGGAAVEAAWDPEHLGPGVTAAPPSVRATVDAAGRAHLDVPVPQGDERPLTLLVGIRAGSHERTRSVEIRRGPVHAVALHVADTRVVPGSAISAWVLVTHASSGEPVASAPVELVLLEGGQARSTLQLTTDAAGTATARVPIPGTREPAWTWTLRARSAGAGEQGAGEADLRLSPREETPGAPRLTARFDEAAVLAGDRAAFTLGVRDATDQPVAGLPVRYWVGPRGTEPPRDKDWERLARAATTDAEGEIHAAADAPSLVVAGVGTTLRMVARTEVEGHGLTQNATVSVGVPTSTAALLPEGGSIVPGVEQRLLLRVLDGHGKPVAASFEVEGDGLAAEVATGAEGEAEVAWKPPADVGALRNVGPCAGGVAAAVRVRPVGEVPALRPRREPFELCLPVDRDAGARVIVDRPLARSGDRVRIRVVAASTAARPPRTGEPGAWSVLIQSGRGERAASLWIEDGEKGAEVELPPGEPGAWSIWAAAPSATGKARLASGAILVTPRVLPALAGRVAGGRAAPGGAVDVDADLTDGHGHGLPGTVSAVLVDLHGGGSTDALEALDARASICRRLGVESERCDRFVDGDPALDGLRRGVLGEATRSPQAPASDPGGEAREALVHTFAEVLRSLEGAVYEASASAERVRDVRRAGPRGSGWNPELMTLVTAAMDTPPRTPGGELFTLADLISVDPQVTFDNVARRVTRLKLFRVLAAVRAFRRDHQLERDEPALRDPNALLRRLVRQGAIAEDLLLDPWGGTLRFVPAAGPQIPFLSVVHGFELHAPGPDGVAGSADDVKDPFERVVRSGTPYARAMDEDRLVDARLDMEVADATVARWQEVLEALTGTALGGGEGIALSGIGAGGSGSGSGRGTLRMGATHRASAGSTTGVHWWSPPVRTDARGHVSFHVPLGDAETTWRIALVGVPDGARQAVTHVDVPVALPLSARVDTGAVWSEGDAVAAAVTVRNRTAKPVHATLSLAASGAARLADARDTERTADVPANGVAVVRIPVVAAAGEAALDVTVRAAGLPDDVVRHRWQVIPAGEPTDLTRAEWVDGAASLSVPVKGPAGQEMRVTGAPRLVLERGLARPLAEALDAMSPDGLGSRAALLDAVEVGARIQRWATAQEGEASPTAVWAAETVRRARGRIAAFGNGGGSSEWLVRTRLRPWVPPEKDEPSRPAACPPDQERDDLATLEAEPAPDGGSALACWDALASSAIDHVGASGDAVALARAFLAVAERPHRAALAATLIDRLRDGVALRPSGAMALPEGQAKNRASRAVVYAALLAGVRLGKPSPAPAERLAAWVGVQRDADGGYGSALATREVVRALLAAAPDEKDVAHVTSTPGGVFEVGPSARVVVPLPAATTEVALSVSGPGLVARLERPALRPWSRPPDGAASPLALDVSWPANARAGTNGVVSVVVRHTRGRATTADVRLPLPPGVTLAEAVSGVRQIGGALLVRRSLDPGGLPVEIDLPVRFGLAGTVTVPEAMATVAFEEEPRAVAPARPMTIR